MCYQLALPAASRRDSPPCRTTPDGAQSTRTPGVRPHRLRSQHPRHRGGLYLAPSTVKPTCNDCTRNSAPPIAPPPPRRRCGVGCSNRQAHWDFGAGKRLAGRRLAGEALGDSQWAGRNGRVRLCPTRPNSERQVVNGYRADLWSFMYYRRWRCRRHRRDRTYDLFDDLSRHPMGRRAVGESFSGSGDVRRTPGAARRI